MGGVVFVEGLIGAGKSTLTAKIASALGLRPVYEPVDDNPFLERSYRDPRRWVFPMQVFLLNRRWAMHRLAAAEAAVGRGAVVDRGLPGDRVFMAMHVEEGNVDGDMWRTYCELYEQMVLGLPTPSLLLYLDVDPQTAHARMVKRGRGVESGVSLRYLVQLHGQYRRMLEDVDSGRHPWSRGMAVHRLPWPENADTDAAVSLVARCLEAK